jgi:L-threonylcarbamoyladenylate synthase
MSRIIDINDGQFFDSAIKESIKVLNAGEVFIYPTDTIYGIGCDIYNENALEKIADIKGRKELQPYIILISSFKMLNEFAVVGDAKHIIEKYWPGPLTIILNSKIKLSKYIDNNAGKIAVRMPDNKFCLELVTRYNKPITSTSANIHAKKQGDFNQIVNEFKSQIDLFIYSGEVKSINPSTIVDLTEDKIKVLRKGAIEDFY